MLHGLYDFLLIGWEATFVTTGMVLVLWVIVIVHARRLVRVERQPTQQVQALTGTHAPVKAAETGGAAPGREVIRVDQVPGRGVMPRRPVRNAR